MSSFPSGDVRLCGDVWLAFVLTPSVSFNGGGRLPFSIRRLPQRWLAGLCLEFHCPSTVSCLDYVFSLRLLCIRFDWMSCVSILRYGIAISCTSLV
ncbi:unnamed protein product [Arabidopsis thaliana]|uniref:Uncharacterized protein n=1 Tax=Arabidopsis thaliana TaxID=3702 RepID=A0A5S9XIK7_ARATH|nr:unnamed protein product [Arabidopsis thaliana]